MLCISPWLFHVPAFHCRMFHRNCITSSYSTGQAIWKYHVHVVYSNYLVNYTPSVHYISEYYNILLIAIICRKIVLPRKSMILSINSCQNNDIDHVNMNSQ